MFVCLCVSEHGTQLGATICTSTCADRDEGGAGGGGGEKTETDKHTLSDLIWLHLCCFICTDTFQGKYCKWVLRVGEVFVSRFEMKHSLLCVSLFIYRYIYRERICYVKIAFQENGCTHKL